MEPLTHRQITNIVNRLDHAIHKAFDDGEYTWEIAINEKEIEGLTYSVKFQKRVIGE